MNSAEFKLKSIWVMHLAIFIIPNKAIKAKWFELTGMNENTTETELTEAMFDKCLNAFHECGAFAYLTK